MVTRGLHSPCTGDRGLRLLGVDGTLVPEVVSLFNGMIPF